MKTFSLITILIGCFSQGCWANVSEHYLCKTLDGRHEMYLITNRLDNQKPSNSTFVLNTFTNYSLSTAANLLNITSSRCDYKNLSKSATCITWDIFSYYSGNPNRDRGWDDELTDFIKVKANTDISKNPTSFTLGIISESEPSSEAFCKKATRQQIRELYVRQGFDAADAP